MTNQTKILLGVGTAILAYLLWKNSKTADTTTTTTTTNANTEVTNSCNIGEELVRLPSGEIVCIKSELLLSANGLNEIAEKYNIPCTIDDNTNDFFSNLFVGEYCPECEEYDKATMLHIQEAGLAKQQRSMQQLPELSSRASFNCKPCIKNIVCRKPFQLDYFMKPTLN